MDKEQSEQAAPASRWNINLIQFRALDRNAPLIFGACAPRACFEISKLTATYVPGPADDSTPTHSFSSIINFAVCVCCVVLLPLLRYDTLLDEPFEHPHNVVVQRQRKLDFPRLCFHVGWLQPSRREGFIGFVCRAHDGFTNVACTRNFVCSSLMDRLSWFSRRFAFPFADGYRQWLMRSFDFLKQIHSFFSEAPNGGSGLDIIIFPKATPFHQTRYEFPAFFVHVGRYRHTHSVCQTWKALKIWKLLFWRWLVKLNFLCPSRSFFVNNNLLNPIILIQFHVHPYTKNHPLPWRNHHYCAHPAAAKNCDQKSFFHISRRALRRRRVLPD